LTIIPSHQRQYIGASGDTGMLREVVFCTYQHLITVAFCPKWIVGEGTGKFVVKAMR
jgi:hypothetical protein